MWVPPLRRDVETLLSRTKNPFFEHADAEYFIAERGNRVVGRIAAIDNRLHNETHHDRVGFFGFFESENDSAVADALFEAAADWLRSRGFDTMRGPASFSVTTATPSGRSGFATTCWCPRVPMRSTTEPAAARIRASLSSSHSIPTRSSMPHGGRAGRACR